MSEFGVSRGMKSSKGSKRGIIVRIQIGAYESITRISYPRNLFKINFLGIFFRLRLEF